MRTILPSSPPANSRESVCVCVCVCVCVKDERGAGRGRRERGHSARGEGTYCMGREDRVGGERGERREHIVRKDRGDTALARQGKRR